MVSDEIAGLRLVRLRGPEGSVHIGLIAGDEIGILPGEDVLAILQADELPRPLERIPLADRATCAPSPPWTLLAPIVAPETWAA